MTLPARMTSRTICGASLRRDAAAVGQHAADGAHGQVGARREVLELAELAPDLGVGRAL